MLLVGGGRLPQKSGIHPGDMARDDDRSARQIARAKQRSAGDRSATLSRTLMQLPAAKLGKLPLEEELRDAIDKARAVTSHIARRRAERELAGALRGHDLRELAEQVAKVEETGTVDAHDFKLAERWRARLLDEGATALAEFPGADDPELPRLIAAALRERTTGKPPGAQRALFRHVMEVLKAQRR
jgi:ribosome-associated protein